MINLEHKPGHNCARWYDKNVVFIYMASKHNRCNTLWLTSCNNTVYMVYIYIALFSALEQTHCAFVACDSKWVTVAFDSLFWISSATEVKHHIPLLYDYNNRGSRWKSCMCLCACVHSCMSMCVCVCVCMLTFWIQH